MKNLLNVLFMVIVAGLLISGCKQKDEIAPKIFLIGDNPYIHTLNDAYAEPGYTAEDNKDGDITSSVTTEFGSFDEDKRGEYELVYTVTDDEGNSASVSRTVNVKNTIETYCLAYGVSKYFGASLDTTYNTTPKPSNTENHFLKFSNFCALNLGINAEIQPDDVDDSPSTVTKKIIVLSQDVFRDTDGYWYRVVGRKTTEGEHLSELVISGSDITMNIKFSMSKSTLADVVLVEDVTWAPAVNYEEIYVKQ